MTPASERKAKERQAKRDAGLVRVEVWVPRDMVDVVKRLVSQKVDRHTKMAEWMSRPTPENTFGLDLTARTVNALHRAGITTREALLSMSDADILAVPNLGRKGLVNIRYGAQLDQPTTKG